MRARSFYLSFVGVLFLSVWTMPFAEANEPARTCDMSAYIKKFGEGKGTCIARAVADRCNSVDACIFECKLSDGDDVHAGGCLRMCTAGKDWEAPPAVAACDK